LCLNFQNFLNRLLPLIDPVLQVKAGRTWARLHKDVNISKIVLVSTSGWWEKGNFGTVIRIAKEFAKDVDVEFAGAVLRPHSDYVMQKNERTTRVFEHCKQAGYQLVKEGKMHADTLKAISRPLISRKKYVE
jgi:hypothetical protein